MVFSEVSVISEGIWKTALREHGKMMIGAYRNLMRFRVAG